MHDHQCVDGSMPSPLPWVIVPSKTPFGAWIMDGTGGCVAAGFGNADAQILLHALENHNACLRYQKILAMNGRETDDPDDALHLHPAPDAR